MEQQQAARLRSNFGIGIEREIYSQPYFSYHYGYKSLSQIPERNSHSKLFEVENKIKEKFELKGQIYALWTYSVNGEDALRWAKEFADLTVKEKA